MRCVYVMYVDMYLCIMYVCILECKFVCLDYAVIIAHLSGGRVWMSMQIRKYIHTVMYFYFL